MVFWTKGNKYLEIGLYEGDTELFKEVVDTQQDLFLEAAKDEFQCDFVLR